MPSKKHHADSKHEPKPASQDTSVQQVESDFGPPIDYDMDGQTGTIHNLDEAIALVEPRSGTFEHPDGIWRGVLEALHYARSSGQPEEMVNARSMLETALGAPPMDDSDDGDGDGD